MTSSNGNISCVIGPLWGESIDHRWIPSFGQWLGALVFYWIFAWINGSVNNRDAGDLRRHRSHYDVIVMIFLECSAPTDIHITMTLRRLKSLVTRLFVAKFAKIHISDPLKAKWYPKQRACNAPPVDSRNKGSVMREGFPCHDVILYGYLCSLNNEIKRSAGSLHSRR